VSGAGDEAQLVLFRQLDHFASQVVDVFAGFVDVAADAGTDLNDGSMHLGLDAFLQAHLSGGQHLGLDVRAQVAGDRVDGLVFLFDAEREGWTHGAPGNSVWQLYCRGRGSGFRDQGSGIRVQGSGFRGQGSGVRNPGSGQPGVGGQ
jgi:hypothetical protein